MMRRWLCGLLTGLAMLAAIGCGDGGPPAAKELTPEQEQQFKAQQSAARESEGKHRE